MTKADADHGRVFDQPFYVARDLAVGGDWPGGPDDQTRFPARLLVDYVRAFLAEN